MKKKNPAAVSLGKRAAEKAKEKYGEEYNAEMKRRALLGKKAHEAYWKKKRAEKEGVHNSDLQY